MSSDSSFSTNAQITAMVAGFSAILDPACLPGVVLGSVDVQPVFPSFALGSTQASGAEGQYTNGPSVGLTHTVQAQVGNTSKRAGWGRWVQLG